MSKPKPETEATGGYLKTAEVIRRYTDPDGGLLFSEQTLAAWRRDGKGPPFIKPGGRPLYPLAGLLEWEAEKGLVPTVQNQANDGA